MMAGLFLWCNVIYIATQQLWSWYALQTKQCKTPAASLKYNVRMSNAWSRESSLRTTLQHSLYTRASLDVCQVGVGAVDQQVKAINGLVELSWSIVAERCWSFAARHSVAPDAYAAYFAGGGGSQELVFNLMVTHAANVYWLDRRRLTDQIAQELWNDCHCIRSIVVRCLYAFFERDGSRSEAGQKLLRGLVDTLSDNNSVE